MNIPIVETYRGVGIHDFQDEERITTVVKPAIDYVYSVSDPQVLFDYAVDAANPPEARMFSADKYKAIDEMRAGEHGRRIGGLQLLDAHVAGLESLGWAGPWCYGTLLDTPPRPGERNGAAPRPPAQGERLAEAQEAARVAERAAVAVPVVSPRQ